jgi:hypothetical protein
MVNEFLALVQSHRRYAALPQLRRIDRRDLRSFQFQRGVRHVSILFFVHPWAHCLRLRAVSFAQRRAESA